MPTNATYSIIQLEVEQTNSTTTNKKKQYKSLRVKPFKNEQMRKKPIKITYPKGIRGPK